MNELKRTKCENHWLNFFVLFCLNSLVVKKKKSRTKFLFMRYFTRREKFGFYFLNINYNVSLLHEICNKYDSIDNVSDKSPPVGYILKLLFCNCFSILNQRTECLLEHLRIYDNYL